jgi:SAM-dependent methyltransferase
VSRFVTNHQLQNKRILDVGSGRGYLQDIVADYTGLDLSPTVAPKYHKPFVVGSATKMPFPDNYFDAAWTVWVVEHIPEPEKAFAEMRRVVKPGGHLLLIVAWNCPTWLADGFEVRPYEDFTLAGKLVKASIPLRTTRVFDSAHHIPIRALRWAQYALSGGGTSLHFRALQPNYNIYWRPDSDAAISIDSYETMLWFQSRGDKCLNCDSRGSELLEAPKPLIIRVDKSTSL